MAKDLKNLSARLEKSKKDVNFQFLKKESNFFYFVDFSLNKIHWILICI